MYIDVVKNRNSPPCILVRESYREEGKVKKRTIANISKFPKAMIDKIAKVIKGATVIDKKPEDIFTIVKTKTHGHVKAVCETIKQLKLTKVFPQDRPDRLRLLTALIAARIIEPKSKLATSRMLDLESGYSSLSQLCGLCETPKAEDIYKTLDWLYPLQDQIEYALAKRHLKNGSTVFYDLTSVWVEGQCCPLAKRGHNRDGNKKPQINIGLLCDQDGRPISCEASEGNTADPKTVKNQLSKLKERFKLDRVVIVGDRGMLTQARIDEDLQHWEGIDYISAFGSDAVQQIMSTGPVQPELFDEEYAAAEITHPDYPGERLVVCYNPQLAQKRNYTRQSLLAQTRLKLDEIKAAVRRKRNPYHGKAKISARIQRECSKYKMLKHCNLRIGEKSFSWHFDEESIQKERKIDGIYIVRSKGVGTEKMDKNALVNTYKNLSQVEQAFRSIKTVDLNIRPMFHYSVKRVRAHVFLCMLAYYVQWHMKEKLKPLLFADEELSREKQNKNNAAEPYRPPESATAKSRSKITADGTTAESFQTLLKKLGEVTWNLVEIDVNTNKEYTEKITQPNSLQKQAFKLLGIKRFW